MAGQVQRHRGQGQVAQGACVFNSRLRGSHFVWWGAGEKLGRLEQFHFHCLALVVSTASPTETADNQESTLLPRVL